MARAAETKTRLCSWGTSRAIRIPKDICEEVGIDIESKLDMNAGRDDRGAFIIIRPDACTHRSFGDAPYRSIEDIFTDYEGGYEPTECAWGNDVGREVIE